MLSSDPHAWLRPLYTALLSHPAFGQFAPSIQFAQLVQAVEREHPSKAATMREWSAAAQHGLLLHLATMADQNESAAPYELWQVNKGDRYLRCVAVYIPSGVDLRLFEGADFRRTQLCKDAPQAYALSDKWRAALVEVGWRLVIPNPCRVRSLPVMHMVRRLKGVLRMSEAKHWFLSLNENDLLTALALVSFSLTLKGRDLSLELQDRALATALSALNELQHTLSSEIAAISRNQAHYPAATLWGVLSDKAAIGNLETALDRALEFARHAE